MLSRMYHWCKDRVSQRTSWDGAVIIALSLVVLFLGQFAEWACYAGILWGIWTIIKDQTHD